ncbi:MAG: hypothetical protein M3123_01525, partial [Actinomycetota bacterium]|nr:hypothetical protein [Actinomycetota bacterium]
MQEPFRNPGVDWAALSPTFVLLGGAAVVLLGALFLPRRHRRPFAAIVSALSCVGAAVAAGILFGLDEEARSIIAESIRRDRLAEFGQILVAGAGLLAVGVSYWESRSPVDEEAPKHLADESERVGEYYALLLAAVAGMG